MFDPMFHGYITMCYIANGKGQTNKRAAQPERTPEITVAKIAQIEVQIELQG